MPFETTIEMNSVSNCMVTFKECTGKDKFKERYVSITEWPNGEGFDVTIDPNTIFSISWQEWEAVQMGILSISNHLSSVRENNVSTIYGIDGNRGQRSGTVANDYDTFPDIPDEIPF